MGAVTTGTSRIEPDGPGALKARTRAGWRRWAVFTLCYALVSGLVIIQLTVLHRDSMVGETRQLVTERLALYERTIRGELQRYRSVPYLVSRTELVHDVLDSAAYVDATNRYLEAAVDDSEADVIYIMAEDGLTLASSNWQAGDSFVGGNFDFRPYFQDAMRGEEGGYFAIGTTSRKPGYYISRPIIIDNGIRGVAVVKIDLAGIEESWNEAGESVFVTDHHDVIILAGEDRWRYRALPPGDGAVEAREKEVPPFLDEPLPVLDLEVHSEGGHEVLKLDGSRFLFGTKALPDLGWELHYLSPMSGVDARTNAAWGGMVILAVALYLFALFVRERQEKLRSRREAGDAARIREINAQLEEEIKVRRETEEELLEAEAELVQAAKMAAVGQMSASVAHEINQPIAAIQTNIASARFLLRRGANKDLNEVLDHVDALVQRMAVMSGQLKTFARKSTESVEPFDLGSCIDNALMLMRSELRREEVSVDLRLPPGGITLMGESVRMEQVLINLFRNAVDAMRGGDRRELRVVSERHGDWVELVVEDSGPGLDGQIERLFEPFYTTKSSGEGLGLGLAIAERIIMGMDGSIHGEETRDGGARFVVRVPGGGPRP